MTSISSGPIPLDLDAMDAMNRQSLGQSASPGKPERHLLSHLEEWSIPRECKDGRYIHLLMDTLLAMVAPALLSFDGT